MKTSVYELTNKPLEHTSPVISEDSLHNHLGPRDMLRRSVGKVLESGEYAELKTESTIRMMERYFGSHPT